jgi:CheY-like chemotaxis protein
MVYGFARQSGGHVTIDSEAGGGTAVKIYFPRLAAADAQADAVEEARAAPSGGRGETILVCEDDPDVRAYSVEVLRELGYVVIEAADGAEAVRLLETATGKIDLLFTDVVLPGGMSGAVVAEKARAISPELPVLFTTGYARNAILPNDGTEAAVDLIPKPFTHADLAARLRDMLDAPTDRAAGQPEAADRQA